MPIEKESTVIARGIIGSVNVGAVREVASNGTTVRTGIWKSSVGERPVRAEGVNLEGDDQGDRRAHGGPDKAVYAYSVEDHAYWHSAAGFAFEPGRFGENLTTEGLDLRAAVVGERWRVGTVVLEVSQPRRPCFKLGLRVDDAEFPKRFLEAGRLGAYLRIVQPGVVRAGDAIYVEHRPAHGVTLALATAALTDASLAPMVATAPELAARWREMIL